MDSTAPAGLLDRVRVDDKIRCVPILDGPHLVGVVTRHDLVRALARTDASVESEVRERLNAYDPNGRWAVTVRDGQVDVGTTFPDQESWRVVIALAETVPGVVSARVHVTTAADTGR
jgi:CBS domain-containing protein